MNSKGLVSREEAVDFLVNRLKIRDAEVLLETGQRRALLEQYKTRYMQTLPFQNIYLLAFDCAWKTPSQEDSIKSILAGTGGLCIDHNTSTSHILRALGYETQLCEGQVQTLGDHVAVVVKNVEVDGDLFLVDLGIGFPLFKPIQIKSADGYLEDTGPITDSFCTYRYVKEGDWFVRYHRKSDSRDGVINMPPIPPVQFEDNKNWIRFMRFHLKEFSHEALSKSIQAIGDANKDDHLFACILLACKYPEGRYIGCQTNVVLQQPAGCQKLEKIGSDVREALTKYFPELPNDMCEKALANFAAKMKRTSARQ